MAETEGVILGCGGSYVVCGREIGPECGTPHMQGYIRFPTQRSVTSVRKKLKGAHVEIAKGDAASNRVYCTKGQDFFEEGRCPLSRVAICKEASVAARNKLLLSGSINDLVVSGHIAVNTVPLLKKARMILDQEVSSYTHDSVRGLWYYGPPGTGKSWSARKEFPDAFIKSQTKWWDGYAGQEVVILDDLDFEGMGHSIKIWTDSYACTGEVKCGTVNLRHHLFVITSNYTPEELFKDPIMAEAVRRRCKMVHFGTEWNKRTAF